MIVKKEDSMEICKDGLDKKATIAMFVAFILNIIIWTIQSFNEIVYVLAIPLFSAIFIGIYLDEKDKYIILSINAEYMEIYKRINKGNCKLDKRIKLNQISKVYIVNYFNTKKDNFWVEILYKDGNDEIKYSFKIYNKQQAKSVFWEYKKDLVIEDRTSIMGIRVKW